MDNNQELYIGVPEKELEETKSKSFVLGWYVGVFCVVAGVVFAWAATWMLR